MNQQITERPNAYRKPEKFADVIGQADPIRLGKRLIRSSWKTSQNGLTLLFEGPYGVGKTLVARLLFKWMRCERQNERLHLDEPCGACDTCKRAETSDFAQDGLLAYYNCARMDDDYLFTLMRTGLHYDAGAMRILDEVHALSPKMQDMLLDELEALSSNIIVVACTNQPEKLNRAFVDRFKSIRFSLIDNGVISAHLKELLEKFQIELDHSYLDVIAYDAGGHVRTAIHQLQKVASGKPESIEGVIEMLSIPHPAPVIRWLESLFQSPEAADAALFGLLRSKNPRPILRTAMDIARFSVYQRLQASERIVQEIVGDLWQTFLTNVPIDDRIKLAEALLRTEPAEINDIEAFRLKSAMISCQLCPIERLFEE